MLLLLSVCVLPACASRGSAERENTRLRTEGLNRERYVDQLETALALREGELLALREQMETSAQPTEGVDPPRVAGIVLGRYTGAMDSDGDGRYDALRAYVRPVDQSSRQIPAEGTARMRLIATPPDGDPRTLVDVTYSLEEFRASYRDGLTGSHYTLSADLPRDVPTTATLHITLTDAATGRRYVAQKPVLLIRGAQISNDE